MPVQAGCATWEAEAGRSLGVRGQAGLHSGS